VSNGLVVIAASIYLLRLATWRRRKTQRP